MTGPLAQRIASLSLALLLPSPATLAYEIPLEPHSIRDAYFLGQRNDQKTLAFFSAYTHHLPLPEKGPYISEVELLTPYAQVVEQSRQNTVGYSAQQAEQDYRIRGDLIRVRVRIEFTPTYNGLESHRSSRDSATGDSFTPRPLDFWRDFSFALKQNDGVIKPKTISGEPIYNNDGTFAGAYVWLEYAAEEVASTDLAVEVFTPDGQHVVVSFDLASLR